MKIIPTIHMAAMATLLAASSVLNAKDNDSIDTAPVTVIYDYSVKTTDADGLPVTDAMKLAVQIGQNVTKSFSYNSFLKQTEDKWDAEMAFTETYLHHPTVWNNYPEGKITTQELIIPNGFEATADLETINWKTSDDTLTIANYACHFATAEFAGITWNVWYTEDIATTAGPWKLNGLPGLIISATDADSIHSFMFNGLSSTPSVITYSKSPEIHKMRNEKMIKYRNSIFCDKQYPKNPIFYIPDLNSSINNFTVINVNKAPRIIADGNFLIVENAHVFQPLELEK